MSLPTAVAPMPSPASMSTMRAPLATASSIAPGAVDACSSRTNAVRPRTVDARAGTTRPVDLQPAAGHGDASAEREQQRRPFGRGAAVHDERLADADHRIDPRSSPAPATRTPSAAIARSASGDGQSASANSAASPSPSTSKRGSTRSSQRGIHHAPEPNMHEHRGNQGHPHQERIDQRRRPPGRTRSAGSTRRPRARTPRTPRT